MKWNKKQVLKKELEKLRDTFATITTMWLEETETCDEVLQPDYPFAMSFDELSSEVNAWVDAAAVELDYTFEKHEKVHYSKPPMVYDGNGSPLEFYFQERKGYEILISTKKEVQDDGYDDWWVESRFVIPIKGWPNE